jgi:hypothetical protein
MLAVFYRRSSPDSPKNRERKALRADIISQDFRPGLLSSARTRAAFPQTRKQSTRLNGAQTQRKEKERKEKADSSAAPAALIGPTLALSAIWDREDRWWGGDGGRRADGAMIATHASLRSAKRCGTREFA